MWYLQQGEEDTGPQEQEHYVEPALCLNPYC